MSAFVKAKAEFEATNGDGSEYQRGGVDGLAIAVAIMAGEDPTFVDDPAPVDDDFPTDADIEDMEIEDDIDRQLEEMAKDEIHND